MSKIKYYKLGTIENYKLKYAIIVTEYKNKWVFVREKGKNTWEMPAGHKKKNEDINITAPRELIEETGAKDFDIIPVTIYSVTEKEIETFGQLFYSKVRSLGELPDYEIEEIKLFDSIPNKITYPLVQRELFRKVLKFLDN